ncbi:MAG: cation transporter [Ruminococcaceae bacterium]|nr:cation transporter [Oscillospiraceae bacterium]
MTNFIIKKIVKNTDKLKEQSVRTRCGTAASAIGIVCNVALFAVKMLVGVLCGSISAVADAVNNLFDGASCIINILAFKLAGKPADKEHPFGHGRYELISAMVIAFLILLIGFEFFKASFQRIFSDETTVFSWIGAVVLALSALAKLWMAVFFKKIGNMISSDSLCATSVDSLSDACVTAVTLVGFIVARFTTLPVDGFVGIAISLFILYSGIKVTRDVINQLLGEKPDKELVASVTEMLMQYDVVLGAHDLIIHSYGPGKYIASVHAEVPQSEDFVMVHDVIDCAEREIMEKLGVFLTVHIDPIDNESEKVQELREMTENAVKQIDIQATIHDFRIVSGPSHTNLIFDVVVPWDTKKSDDEIKNELEKRIKANGESYYVVATLERSYV